MKKNESNQPQTQPSDPEEQPDQPTQDNLSQDDLSNEELDEVSGGVSGNATGRRMYLPIRITTPVGQAAPIMLE